MKTAITRRLVLIYLFIFCSVFAQAHTGSLKGYIYDGNSHKPLEGANVYIKELNGSAVTDAFGLFFIKGLKDGGATVVISHIGYETYTQHVVIEDGVTKDLATVNMVPAEVKMSNVTVNA